MSNDYSRPPAGRTYHDTLSRHEQASRIAARENARQHTPEINAAQKLTCWADTRFKHLITNELACARCDETLQQILERHHQ